MIRSCVLIVRVRDIKRKIVVVRMFVNVVVVDIIRLFVIGCLVIIR